MTPDEIFTAEPAPTRSGGSNRLLVGLGVGCGIVALLCCGGFVGLGVMTAKMAREAFTDDPAVVRKTTDEITTIRVPAQFEPVGAMDLKVPVVGTRITRTVFYRVGEEGKEGGILVLAEFDREMFSGQDPDQLSLKVEQSMKEKGEDQEDVEVVDKEELERTVGGKPARFVISRGVGKESKTQMWQVTGTFEGEGGPVIVILIAKVENVSRKDIQELLESIE